MNNQFNLAIALLVLFLGWGLSLVDHSIPISKEEARRMGEQIWLNECSQRFEGLTSWNEGEEFASLGIGHFIWYPHESLGPFRQTFPDFLAFLREKHISLPQWLQDVSHCPWKSRKAFQTDFQGDKMIELRELLAATIDLQIVFMINRLQKALPSILETMPDDKKKAIRLQFYRLTGSSAGLYTLLDYINFKGEGISCRECYLGKGWGLKQVLELMPGNTNDPVREFVETAKMILTQRVEHAPPERNEKKWLKGWSNRIETYLHFSMEKKN
jgi:hypothetical protein